MWWSFTNCYTPALLFIFRFSSINNHLVCSLPIHIICALAVYLVRFLWYWRRKTPMTLKSGFRVGQGHWKLHQWIPYVLILLVINCTRGRILYRLWDMPSIGPPSLYFDTLLRLTPPTEVFLWDDLRKILHRGQRMAKVHSGEEILPKAATPWAGRTNVKDRQTTDRRFYHSKYRNVV